MWTNMFAIVYYCPTAVNDHTFFYPFTAHHILLLCKCYLYLELHLFLFFFFHHFLFLTLLMQYAFWIWQTTQILPALPQQSNISVYCSRQQPCCKQRLRYNNGCVSLWWSACNFEHKRKKKITTTVVWCSETTHTNQTEKLREGWGNVCAVVVKVLLES